MSAEAREPGATRQQRWGVFLPTAVTTAVLLALILAAMRYIPGGPLAETAQPRWHLPPGVTSSANAPAPAALAETSSPPNAVLAVPRMERPLPAVRPAAVVLKAAGWWSWALLDRRTGLISGSRNWAETSTTASLIKAWIAADYLRRATAAGSTPNSSRMRQVRVMIRDSDNTAAQSLWGQVGGSASIKRLIRICGLTDSSSYRQLWSNTRLSARDTARMGACIADGRAAGKKWTGWLLGEMRAVRGGGDFGIRKAFPAADARTIAIKNGWVTRDATGEWHVNCLAIGHLWTIAVMTRYPAQRGYAYGAKTCQNVAAQLRA